MQVPNHQHIAAYTIAATALIVLVALFHHPVAGTQGDAALLPAQIAQLAHKDRLVHGVLIVMLAMLTRALRSLQPASATGLAAHALGSVLLGVAMLFDGFIVPNVAGIPDSLPMLQAMGLAIQVFSKAGLLAHCAAMLGWAYASRRSAAWFACVGMLASSLPAAALLFSDLRLTPHSLMAIFTIQAVWYLSAAWLLLRR
ncbi:hypothetical protein GJ699_10970 [Duganella sp. FT80W]|uniref:DUF4386 family protein n=1 Tax=Duganella guangzhouensis TaxID=2666084 RepID=A0A6I2KWX4_9BURK|nr:hypothetical protein [Duganella guangzhouensis]MRW90508.1 hypothetical protein [Duganella guangzhouensis]